MLNCAHLESERKGVVASRPSFTRYAIYFTPQPGTALAAFGRSWFGRANDGATLQAFSDSGFAGTGFAKVAVGARPLYRPARSVQGAVRAARRRSGSMRSSRG